MTYEEIIKLSELGFSKDDIMKLTGNTSSVPENDKSQENIEPAPIIKEDKAETPEQINPVDDKYNALMDEIKDLKKNLHVKNIQESTMPEEKELSVIDVMNQILR